MYTVIMPSTKVGGGNKRAGQVYMRELDNATIIKYLRAHPISYPDEKRVLNMLFDERFYDNKIRQKWANLIRRSYRELTSW